MKCRKNGVNDLRRLSPRNQNFKDSANIIQNFKDMKNLIKQIATLLDGAYYFCVLRWYYLITFYYWHLIRTLK